MLFKSVTGLKHSFDMHLNKIDDALFKELANYKGSPFYNVLVYAVDAGKRIRPLILLLSAESVGQKGEDPLPSAVAIELLHIESLIHDDIIDHEKARRGLSPVHIRFGYVPAILSADFILAAILNIVSRYRDSCIAQEFASTVRKMCDGELTEHKSADREKMAFDEYLNIIENKTASLFSASARIGAIVGEGKETEIETLSNFGRLLGVSYQIKDDITDINSDVATFNLRKIYDWTDLDTPKKIIIKYSQDAIKSLNPLKDSKAKTQLIDLAKSALI